MKIVSAYSSGCHWAVVTYDNEWEEYVVQFGTDETMHQEASYHTDDKDDAIETAQAEVERMDNV